MKKKILITLTLVFVMVVALAFSVSAADKVIKLTSCPTLEEIHANPSAYVSHLDAYDENWRYTSDPDSLVVLCDQQETKTWYVFPTAYVITSGAYTLDYTGLNTALQAADSTAFASYSRDTGGRGGSTFMIRIEVPTYVTSFNYDKFENCPELLEVYFPTHIVTDAETGVQREVTYFSEFKQADFFSAGKKIQKIHNVDKVPVTYLTNAFFSGCSSLTYVKLPTGLTSIVGSCFNGCSSLEYIEIPAGVTSIGGSAFKGCSSLKEVILPNGVTSIGKGAFYNCSSMETFSFGAGFTTFSRVNQDYETFQLCSSLKYVYMPTGFLTAVSGAKAGDYKHIFNSMDSAKVTYFFTGTKAQAEEIVRLMASTNNNPYLGNATVEAYNPNTNYENYGATIGSNVIVYGYSPCDAFYNGAHTEAQTTLGFEGEKYTTPYCSFTGCTRAGCNDVDIVEIAGALFENKGYSKVEDGSSFTYGIIINEANIAKYKAATKEDITYGFIVGAVPNSPTGDIISASGESLLEKTVVADFTTLTAKNLTVYNVKMVGIDTDLQKAQAIYCCAYVIDGSAISYIGEKVTDKAVSVSSDSILVIETTTTTPPTTDENA